MCWALDPRPERMWCTAQDGTCSLAPEHRRFVQATNGTPLVRRWPPSWVSRSYSSAARPSGPRRASSALARGPIGSRNPVCPAYLRSFGARSDWTAPTRPKRFRHWSAVLARHRRADVAHVRAQVAPALHKLVAVVVLPAVEGRVAEGRAAVAHARAAPQRVVGVVVLRERGAAHRVAHLRLEISLALRR